MVFGSVQERCLYFSSSSMFCRVCSLFVQAFISFQYKFDFFRIPNLSAILFLWSHLKNQSSSSILSTVSSSYVSFVPYTQYTQSICFHSIRATKNIILRIYKIIRFRWMLCWIKTFSKTELYFLFENLRSISEKIINLADGKKVPVRGDFVEIVEHNSINDVALPLTKHFQKILIIFFITTF